MGVEALLLSQVITISGSTGQVVTKQADGSLALQDAPAAGVGGSTGATDNAILRADGTGGATLQNSGVTISDNSEVLIVSGAASAVPLTVRGAASQTAALIVAEAHSGVQLKFDSDATNVNYLYIGSSHSETRIGVINGELYMMPNGGTAARFTSDGIDINGKKIVFASIVGFERTAIGGITGCVVGSSDAAVTFRAGNNAVGRFDDSVTAGNTRMLLWDVDSAAMVRVSVGAADSGGVGFKVLRIPN